MTIDVDDPRVVHQWDDGIGWIAHLEETMQRASQAIIGERGVWLVDPVDMEGLDNVLEQLGEVAGIVVLLDRHKRDASKLALRYDVPIHLPRGVSGLRASTEAETVGVDAFLTDTGFEVRSIVDVPGWTEYALCDLAGETVIIAEALGTAEYFCAPGELLGVHPVLRLFPPREALGDLTAERVLVGHGPGLMTGGTAAIHDALHGARRRAPRVYLRALRQAPRILYANVRG